MLLGLLRSSPKCRGTSWPGTDEGPFPRRYCFSRAIPLVSDPTIQDNLRESPTTCSDDLRGREPHLHRRGICRATSLPAQGRCLAGNEECTGCHRIISQRPLRCRFFAVRSLTGILSCLSQRTCSRALWRAQLTRHDSLPGSNCYANVYVRVEQISANNRGGLRGFAVVELRGKYPNTTLSMALHSFFLAGNRDKSGRERGSLTDRSVIKGCRATASLRTATLR